MKRLILTITGVALAAACSRGDDRGTPVADNNLTRPLEVARVDTTQPLAPVEREVTRPPEPATMPKPRKAKSPAKKAAKPPVATPPVVAPEENTAVEDTTVMGYAPDTSASVPDSAPAPARDTALTPARDTAANAPDTTTGPVSDTIASRTPDTASTAAINSAVTDSAVTDSVAGNAGTMARAPTATVTHAARTLPIGTEIHAALDDSINSRTDTVGRVITAVVMENVIGADGKTLIAAGAPVQFTVTRLSPARSKSAQGRLRLKAEGVGIGGGIQKISAEVKPVPHELRGRGVTAGDAAKVGVGAAGGAVLGKVIGKSTKGAVIGGVIGAAGGAVVASQTATRDVVVKAKTPVVFVLTQPLVAQ